MSAADANDRFWEKVNKTPGCWLWTGCIVRGQGQFHPSTLRGRVKAHRYSYESVFGPIPAGLFVLHSCDVGHCVRPSHLHIGTLADNNREMLERNRQARGERHGNSKLTSARVAEIRAIALRRGRALRSIAGQFGVSARCVSHVLNGETWGAVQ